MCLHDPENKEIVAAGMQHVYVRQDLESLSTSLAYQSHPARGKTAGELNQLEQRN
jgi:hypothetical protein